MYTFYGSLLIGQETISRLLSDLSLSVKDDAQIQCLQQDNKKLFTPEMCDYLLEQISKYAIYSSHTPQSVIINLQKNADNG
jgi:uncharacterized protein YhdP